MANDEPKKEKLEVLVVESIYLPPVIAQVHNHYTTSEEFASRQVSMLELNQYVEENKKCIAVFTVANGEGISELTSFIQRHRKKIRVKRVIPIALLKSANRRVESLLLKSGCTEVYPFSTSHKSLTLKLNRQLRLLELNNKEVEDEFAVVGKKGQSDQPGKDEPEIIFTAPIEEKSDFWILLKQSNAKRYLSKWLVSLIGPSPAAGSWNKCSEYESLFPKGETQWEWIANDPEGLFHTGAGKWIICGTVPEYNWGLNSWGFIGEFAELAFVYEGKILYSRFKAFSKNKFHISNNSKYSASIFDKIKETYDKTESFSSKTIAPPEWEEQIDQFVNAKDLTAEDVSAIEGVDLQGAISETKSLDEDPEFLKSLLEAPGFKIQGSVNNNEIELLGFGEEPNTILVGYSNSIGNENDVVEITLTSESNSKKVQNEIKANILKIFSMQSGKFVGKLLVLDEFISELDKVKKSFLERGKQATSFIKKAKGITLTPEKEEFTQKDEDMVREFLQNNHIIIMDSVSAARVNLASLVVKLGGVRKKMSLVGSIQEAKDELEKNKAKIFFSDYMVGSQSGLSFIQDVKLNFDKAGDRMSVAILVTSNASQSAVAQAAEGDIDNFVIKPYPFENLRKVVRQTILDKLNPTPYLKAINDAKDFILIGDDDKAIELLKGAIKLDAHPSLALSYLGRCYISKKDYPAAEKCFKDALTHNEIHCASLNGLHDLLFEQRRFEEAYEVARNLVRFFPAHAKRLSNVLRASIVTDNFKDILEYYDVYLGLDDKTEELIRYVCSATVVGGKHFLNRKNKVNAFSLFEKAATSAGGRTQYLLYIIETLVVHNLGTECQPYLKRLKSLAPASDDYATANFLAASLTLPTIDIVHQGRELMKKGIENPYVYQRLIHHSKIAGYQEAAEELSRKAVQKWPDKKELF